MNRLALEQLDVRPGERVLEVGFGGGELIERLLAATNAEVKGVELSEAMLARARRRFPTEVEQGRLKLFAGSADALPMESGSIDKACSVNSIYFWPDPSAVISEFARVLRPGGRLVLCFQTPDSVRAWPGHVHGFRAPSAAEIAGLMEASGFGPVRTSCGEDRQVGEFTCLSGERDDGR